MNDQDVALLIAAVRKANAVEYSVTQGQEREERATYRDVLHRGMKAADRLAAAMVAPETEKTP